MSSSSFAPDELVVNHYDACIYGRDLRLLDARTEWLNDACLHFALTDLQQQQSSTMNLFLDPSVVSFFMHQCHDDDDVQDFVQGSCHGLSNAVHRLVIPINDTLTAAHWTVPGLGTHWSLLLLEQQTACRGGDDDQSVMAWHFDSIVRSGNARVAQAVTDKLYQAAPSWFGDATVRVTPCPTPPQRNGYDCGVHVIAAARAIAAVAAEAQSSTSSICSSGRSPRAYESKLKEIMEQDDACWKLRQSIADRTRELAHAQNS